MPNTAAFQKLIEKGWGKMNDNAGGSGVIVSFELYNVPRFTVPDESGNVTLDYGFYLAD